MPIPPEIKERLCHDEKLVSKVGVPSPEDWEVLDKAWELTEEIQSGHYLVEDIMRNYSLHVIDLVVGVSDLIFRRRAAGTFETYNDNGH